jgi:hypothetical protein
MPQLEKLMEQLTFELKTTDLRTLFIEDPYRLQTVIDDHMRRMEELETATKAMVAEWEGK